METQWGEKKSSRFVSKVDNEDERGREKSIIIIIIVIRKRRQFTLAPPLIIVVRLPCLNSIAVHVPRSVAHFVHNLHPPHDFEQQRRSITSNTHNDSCYPIHTGFTNSRAFARKSPNILATCIQ